MATIDRKIFFDSVRPHPFPGKLTTEQVEGMEAILDAWEEDFGLWDLRWLSYALATTLHETASTMQPIEEYQGASASYGQPDKETGQCYYGRGFVQLTHRTNYARADKELGLAGENSCEWHAENALDPEYAAAIMFRGMAEGWFRSNSGGQPFTFAMFFNDTRTDPYGARDIINGDKTYTPDWANGTSIGALIEGYYDDFLDALSKAYVEDPGPPFVVEPAPGMHETVYRVTITGEGPFTVTVVEEKSGPA